MKFSVTYCSRKNLAFTCSLDGQTLSVHCMPHTGCVARCTEMNKEVEFSTSVKPQDEKENMSKGNKYATGNVKGGKC